MELYDKIMKIENPKESTKMILKPVNELVNITGKKLKIQNRLYFYIPLMDNLKQNLNILI